MIFHDRRQAGKILAEELSKYHRNPRTLVLGLARGGIPVAYEIAKALDLPLNVLVPRKISFPENPELAIGAIIETGSGYFNKSLIQSLGVPSEYIDREVAEQKALAQERVAKYRKNAPLEGISGITVIIVDDGIATGATMFAAVSAVRDLGAKKVVAAIPVGAADSLQMLENLADEVVCLQRSDQFGAVGFYYRNFEQTSDNEVIDLLSLSL